MEFIAAFGMVYRVSHDGTPVSDAPECVEPPVVVSDGAASPARPEPVSDIGIPQPDVRDHPMNTSE